MANTVRNNIIKGRLLFSQNYRYFVPYETNTKENIFIGPILFGVVTPEVHRKKPMSSARAEAAGDHPEL